MTRSGKSSTDGIERSGAGKRVERFLDAAAIVGLSDDPDALHQVRIAAKRLRYAIELHPELFGAAGEAAIDTLKTMQDDLGQLHDLDVTLDLIGEELAAVASEELARARAGQAVPARNPERVSLLTLASRVGRLRQDRHAAFVTRWRSLVDDEFPSALRALGSE